MQLGWHRTIPDAVLAASHGTDQSAVAVTEPPTPCLHLENDKTCQEEVARPTVCGVDYPDLSVLHWGNMAALCRGHLPSGIIFANKKRVVLIAPAKIYDKTICK